MAFHAEDRVAGMSTTSGTGNLTLSGTVPYLYRPIHGPYAVGDEFDALIISADGSSWEQSKCQLATATTIARLKVYSNSLSTTAFINFNSSAKTIFVDLPAAKANIYNSQMYTDGTYF